jgi:hypothetical protein
MNPLPFSDSTGKVKAWLDRKSNWVFDLGGDAFSLISGDSWFNRTGAQIGWWYGDHLRDRRGRVVLVRSGVGIAGIRIPPHATVPHAGYLNVPPERPALNLLAGPAPRRDDWAGFEPPHGLDRLRVWVQATCRESEPASAIQVRRQGPSCNSQ